MEAALFPSQAGSICRSCLASFDSGNPPTRRTTSARRRPSYDDAVSCAPACCTGRWSVKADYDRRVAFDVMGLLRTKDKRLQVCSRVLRTKLVGFAEKSIAVCLVSLRRRQCVRVSVWMGRAQRAVTQRCCSQGLDFRRLFCQRPPRWRCYCMGDYIVESDVVC